MRIIAPLLLLASSALAGSSFRIVKRAGSGVVGVINSIAPGRSDLQRSWVWDTEELYRYRTIQGQQRWSQRFVESRYGLCLRGVRLLRFLSDPLWR